MEHWNQAVQEVRHLPSLVILKIIMFTVNKWTWGSSSDTPKNWLKPKQSVIELCNFLYLLNLPLLIITNLDGSFFSHLYLCFPLQHMLSEEIMQRLLSSLHPGCTLFDKTEVPALLEKFRGPSHTENLQFSFHLWETGRQRATASPYCISLVAVAMLPISYFKKKKNPKNGMCHDSNEREQNRKSV